MSDVMRVEKEYRVKVPEIVLTEYVVKALSPYEALGKAQYESTYRMKKSDEVGSVNPTISPWFVYLNGRSVPFSMTEGEDGSYWHVWGMEKEND